MKEQKKDLLIILGMSILLLLIVIPPLLRTIVPKQQKSIITKEEKDINTTMICTKDFPTENYTVVANITYKNKTLVSNQITYNKVENLETTSNNIQGYLPSQEIPFFKNLKNINIKETTNSTIITLDNSVKVNNPNNELLNNYLLDEKQEQTYYKSQGYTCEKKTN